MKGKLLSGKAPDYTFYYLVSFLEVGNFCKKILFELKHKEKFFSASLMTYFEPLSPFATKFLNLSYAKVKISMAFKCQKRITDNALFDQKRTEKSQAKIHWRRIWHRLYSLQTDSTMKHRDHCKSLHKERSLKSNACLNDVRERSL